MYTTRPATPADADIIARYNQAMAQETENKALSLEVVGPGVRRVLNEPSHGRYLVAVSDAGEVVGCLLITYEWSDWRNAQVWWVQSVYVHPEHRRRGVFGLLYQAVRELGESVGGVCGYRLYVERDNTRAQRTYEGLGMNQTAYLMYEDLLE
ncbi:MAG: N-acetyltransferase [Planctomycetota bacterium]